MNRTTMMMAGLATLFLATAATGVASADASRRSDQGDEAVTILAGPTRGRYCPVPGMLCAFPGARRTVNSVLPIASRSHVPPMAFARAQPTASRQTTAPYPVSDSVPWTIEVVAELKHPAQAGNALFLLYDASDPEAVRNHEVTAIHQAHIPAGDLLSARLSASIIDGVAPGRTYLLRVVQIIHGREVLLVEGEIFLK